MKPKISVITVSWNKKKDVADLIRSLKKQAHPNFEIIVVDNASTDGTIPYLKKNFRDVKTIALDKNYGLYYGLNTGIRIARGDLIIVIDHDCILLETNILKKVVEKFKKNPSLGIATFAVYNYYSKDLMVDNPLPQRLSNLSNYPCVFNGCGFAIKKDVAIKAGLFDESLFIYCGELDLTVRVIEKGSSCLYYSDLKVYHKAENKQKTTFFYDKIVVRNRIWLSFKYLSLLSIGMISLINLTKFIKRHGIINGTKLLLEIVIGLPKILKKRSKISRRTVILTYVSNYKYENVNIFKKFYFRIIRLNTI